MRILITGTPGVGKTTLCKKVKGFKHIEVSEAIKTHRLYSEVDNERDCTVYDEDKVLDYVNGLKDKDIIFDFHSPSIFSQAGLDLIIVVRTSTETLYDRLVARGYSTEKVRENVECEIFGECKIECEEHIPDVTLVEFDSADSESILQYILNAHKDCRKG